MDFFYLNYVENDNNPELYVSISEKKKIDIGENIARP